jgi:hypothetical protein
VKREIFDYLVSCQASVGARVFVPERSIVERFAGRFLGRWRALRALRRLATDGVIGCCSTSHGVWCSSSLPWFVGRPTFTRKYRALP